MTDKLEPPIKDGLTFATTWEEQEKQDILFRARNSTPMQRLEWLEAAIRFAASVEAKVKN